MILLYYELSPRAGAVVQLGERFPCTEEVAGSSPVSSTNINNVWKQDRCYGKENNGMIP